MQNRAQENNQETTKARSGKNGKKGQREQRTCRKDIFSISIYLYLKTESQTDRTDTKQKKVAMKTHTCDKKYIERSERSGVPKQTQLVRKRRNQYKQLKKSKAQTTGIKDMARTTNRRKSKNHHKRSDTNPNRPPAHSEQAAATKSDRPANAPIPQRSKKAGREQENGRRKVQLKRGRKV